MASTNQAMRALELFELQTREGPCLDAFRTGGRVEHEVLQPGKGRWPRFSAVALDTGFRSAFALPLRLRERTIGALNLFSTQPFPMSEMDVTVARALADLATISVARHLAIAETQLVNTQLTHALESRILIEQAKGVISERANLDMDVAFTRLRNYGRSHNLRIIEIARAVIEGRLDPRAWQSPPGPSRS